ncbi:MAG: amidohydrolase family protein, partial [Thermoanaerobaculia bacterium]|nr:amidohydrolase family protein [Thermoanaerobaculia bacterium]
GTDMGVPLTFPGFALHDELELMVERIGISHLAALRAATSHPAELFDVAAGSIAPDMPADLVLLDEDPLVDISNTRTIEAVVLDGRLIDSAELAELREWVRENKDREPDSTPYDRLEADCRAAESADCLERLAGYQFSLFRYADARETYQQALDRGAGEMALEGLFSSTVNLLHTGEIACDEAAATAETMLASHTGAPNKLVGVLDRFLAPATERCPGETETFLTRLAALDESALDDEMRPIYRAHFASYLAKVEDDEEAAYDYRIARMPEGWKENVAQLQEVAGWCLKQGLALDKGRELARKATGIAPDPVGRLESMLLQARLASAAGDHGEAVTLMETIDEAVPNNETVQGLLETFRKLAAEADAPTDD